MNDGNNAAAPSANRETILCLILAVVFLLHAVQVFSPLRLNTDACRLLSLAWSAHSTGDFLVDGHADQYPLGYPRMLRLLFDLGLARTWWINSLGFGFLTVALLGWWRLLNQLPGFDRAAAMTVLLIFLLSWVTVKHASIPLTELPFLGLSAWSLVFLWVFWQQKARIIWGMWLGAFVLAVAAMQVRTIGVSLVGTVMASMVIHPAVTTLYRQAVTWRTGILIAGGLVLVMAAAVLRIRQSACFESQANGPESYLQLLGAAIVHNGMGHVITASLGFRLSELGELALNFPASRLSAFAGYLLSAAGLLLLTLIGWSVWRTAHSLTPLVIYGLAYGAILCIWPCADPRFFLPVLPLIATLIIAAFCQSKNGRLFRLASVVYGFSFACLGLLALAYSLRITFSGSDFPTRYGDGHLRDTYFYAFGQIDKADIQKVDAKAVALLQHLEPRADRCLSP